MAASDLTAERLRELLDYNPITGLFTWRRTHHPKCQKGAVAGTKGTAQYTVICIDRVLHYAHRLAFLHVTGEWPVELVDHRDGDKHNNAWANLRNGPQALNMQNRKRATKASKTGVLGVMKRRNRFVAQVSSQTGNAFVGSYKTIEEAQEAYLARKRETHEFNTL